MKPSQVAVVLRRIASKIQASKNPDKNLVAKDLKKIISALQMESNIDWSAIENELNNELNNWNGKAMPFHDSITFNAGKSFGLDFTAFTDYVYDPKIGLDVSYDDEGDEYIEPQTVWYGPLSELDAKKVSHDAISMMKEMVTKSVLEA